jgi:hypothetical protein
LVADSSGYERMFATTFQSPGVAPHNQLRMVMSQDRDDALQVSSA